MYQKNKNNVILALFVSLVFSLWVNVYLIQKSSYTAELAKVVGINADQTIIIRNMGGQEKLIRTKAADSKDLQLNATYWIEYKTNLGQMPRLVSYNWIEFVE